MRRVEEDGNREAAGPSLIDFITNSVIHLNDPAYDAAAAFATLHRKLDPAIEANVIQAVAQAKQEAVTIRGQLGNRSLSNNVQEDLAGLKTHPAFKALIQ